MTVALSSKEIIDTLKDKFPGVVEEAGPDSVLVESNSLVAIAEYLKTAEGLKFEYLNYITAVDYYSYFEVVYHMTSLEYNRSLIIKARCYDHDKPIIPSVISVWQGADFQEREIFDLFGITFQGHPNLTRIFLWEGFPGHPLRKDFNQ